MKRCPKCNREYSDRMLEFCLEDGARLISQTVTLTSEETVVLPQTTFQQNTVTNPLSPAQNAEIEATKTTKVQELKEKAVDRGYRILEVTPIVFALIHNYWQWLYAEKQHSYSITDFLLSSSFIVWFILLILSTGLSVSALKFGKNKGFAITSLIILAINFLLFIVPRR